MSPVVFYTKKQGSIESSSCGSELSAMKTAVELIEGLCFKLRMMGILLEEPTRVLADNTSVIHNCSNPASQLKKTMALISKHYDEVRAIVNNARRAAVVWHRMNGPELMKIALAWPGEARPFLPKVLGEIDVGSGIRRLLDVIRPIATPALAADIDRFAPFAQSIPGKRLSDLSLGSEDG